MSVAETKIVRSASEVVQTMANETKGTRLVKLPNGKLAERVVVSTLDECLANEGDFYHPAHGWLRSGGKREVDPDYVGGRIFGEE